jgi:tetratricopeptide (TPR) repeat protein
MNFPQKESLLAKMKWSILITLFFIIVLSPAQARAVDATIPNEQALVKSGDDFFSKKMFKEAINEYNKALEINPGNTYINKKLGMSYLQLGDYNLAFIPLAKALKSDPRDAEAAVNLGLLYKKKNELSKSIPFYEKAVSIEPQNVWYRYLLAESLTWLEQFDEAIIQYNKILEIDPKDNGVRILLSQVYARKAKKEKKDEYYDDALKELGQVLKKEPGNVKALSEAGAIYLEIRNISKAKEKLEKAYNLDPNDYDVQMRLAQVHSWGRDYDKAIRLYNQVLSQKPQDMGALYRLGEVYSWQKEYKKSIECYNEILKISPENEGALTAKARVYALQKKYADADIIIESILKKDSENVGALMTKAEMNTWRKDYDKAMDCYNVVLKKEPDNSGAMIGKARVYALQGSYESADILFDYVLEKEPDNTWALMSKAETETWQWKWKSATNDYKKVLQNDSGNMGASDALKDIDFITSPSLEGVVGVFTDSDEFERRWAGGTLSLKPSDKTQIDFGYLRWIFQQGDDTQKIYREDATFKIKQHLSRFLDVEAGYMFNRHTNEEGDKEFEHQENAGTSSATVTFPDTANIFLSYNYNVPVSDSILAIRNYFTADVFGVGLNFIYLDPVSLQGGYSSSKYSDENKKTTSEVQLTLRAYDDPNISFRGKYTTLSFERETDIYWSPLDYRINYFIISVEKNFWKRSSIGIEGTEAYFVEEKKWGSGVSGFLNIIISDTLCVNVYGSYFNADTKDPWTGNAAGAKIKIVF